MAFKKVNMLNKRFGNLVVLKEVDKSYNGYIYKCKCDCGNEVSVLGSSLRSGNTKSCGCLRKITASNMRRKGITYVSDWNK